VSSWWGRFQGREIFVKQGHEIAGAVVLQMLVSVLIGFVLMIVMVGCFLAATVFLLVIMSWVVDGASRVLGASSRNPLG
jgi:hypothetical protein